MNTKSTVNIVSAREFALIRDRCFDMLESVQRNVSLMALKTWTTGRQVLESGGKNELKDLECNTDPLLEREWLYMVNQELKLK
jgi:hypothetical protein